MREACQNKTEDTILEWFQANQLHHPYSPEIDRPLEGTSSKESHLEIETQKLEKEKLIYKQFLKDIGRCDMVLEEGKESIVISGSEPTLPSAKSEAFQEQKVDDGGQTSALSIDEGIVQAVKISANKPPAKLTKTTDPQIDALSKFKAFIGYDHQQLGIAIGRMMNQTMLADCETIRGLRIHTPNESVKLGYSDKGFLYFQYIPSVSERKESVSHILTKESNESFKITSNLYREMRFSSKEGEDDLLLQVHYQVSCRMSESPNYDPSREMTIENLPCQVEYLDFGADYQVRQT